MILSESDRELYFPSVKLIGDELIGAIRRSQLIAESSLAAGRSLEKNNRLEYLQPNRVTGYARLTFPPVIEVFAISVQHSGYVDGFGRSIARGGYRLIGEDAYSLDPDEGTIGVDRNISSVKISYLGGYDFSQDSSDIQEIKAAVGAILAYMESLPGKGVTSFRPGGVNYVNSFGQIPDYLLIPLRKFQPISI